MPFVDPAFSVFDSLENSTTEVSLHFWSVRAQSNRWHRKKIEGAERAALKYPAPVVVLLTGRALRTLGCLRNGQKSKRHFTMTRTRSSSSTMNRGPWLGVGSEMSIRDLIPSWFPSFIIRLQAWIDSWPFLLEAIMLLVKWVLVRIRHDCGWSSERVFAGHLHFCIAQTTKWFNSCYLLTWTATGLLWDCSIVWRPSLASGYFKLGLRSTDSCAN